MASQLTTGAIKEMFLKKQTESPQLQVLYTKQINGDRHRLYLNDGQYSTGAAMIAIQLNKMILSNEVDKNCIVKVTRFICNDVGQGATKRVLVILDMTVVKSGSEVGERIGNPTALTGTEAFENDSSTKSTNMTNSARPNAPLGSYNQSTVSPKKSSESNFNKPVTGIHPISSLTPYQNRWTIRARVTNKSAIRTWSNARGEGKLFNVDLLDESGEIRATSFNEQCDKYYEFLQIDKVYYFSQAQLKTANKQYTSLKNDYEMTFNQGSQIVHCEEATTIPTMQYDFKSINDIESMDKDTIVDVIGVCKSFGEVKKITVKATQKEVAKRDIQLVDYSGKEICLTVWSSTAENFDGENNPIIAIKGVKVSDFNGKSISSINSSMLQMNPDINESHKLRAWFENEGSSMETVNLSNQRTAGGGSSGNIKMIGEAIQQNLGVSGNADYYSTMAYTAFIRKENVLYSACPAEGCNKKVIDMNNGIYRCEKCNKEYDTFNWRLMVSACLADSTNSVWVMLFQDQAEVLLGHTAAELGAMKEQDDEAFLDVISKSCFKFFNYKIKVKLETYNDESRLKSTVVSIQKVDYNQYNSYLISDIKKMCGMN